MLKFWSVLLVFVLIIPIILIPANAIVISDDIANTKEYLTKDEVFEKVTTAFPEYEDKILGNFHSQQDMYILSQNLTSVELIVSETRSLSEQEEVTYQEYSNGTTLTWYNFTTGKTIKDEYDFNGRDYYVIDIYLTVSFSDDVIIVGDIECAIDDYYGYINDKGTPLQDSVGDTYPVVSEASYKSFGSNTNPAHIEYFADFEFDYTVETLYSPVYIRLEVSPSGMVVTGGLYVE